MSANVTVEQKSELRIPTSTTQQTKIIAQVLEDFRWAWSQPETLE